MAMCMGRVVISTDFDVAGDAFGRDPEPDLESELESDPELEPELD